MSRVIIAGCRVITDYEWLKKAIERSGYTITEVVSGKEPNGVDALGERWARERGIPIRDFPANWGFYGDSAGPIRNTSMSVYADAAIILRSPVTIKSNGSDDMYKKMRLLGKPVYREFQGN